MIGECGHAAVAEVKRLSENTKQLWQCTECGAIGEIEADWFTVLSEARQEGVGYCAAKTRHCPRCGDDLVAGFLWNADRLECESCDLVESAEWFDGYDACLADLGLKKEEE